MTIGILGGGYWGVACALMLESKGINTVIIDSSEKMSGSKAAGGHFSLKWFKGSFKKEMETAYSDALKHGVLFDTSGAVINTLYDRKKFGKDYLKPKKDWWAFHPNQFLNLRSPDIYGFVSKFIQEDNYVRIKIKGRYDLVVDKLIICAGAWTDYILQQSGVSPIGVSYLAGSGVTYKGRNISNIILHQTTPFRQVSIRNWGDNIIRVGETSETHLKKHSDYVEKMLNTVGHHTSAYSIGEVMTGYRAMRKQPFVGSVAKNVYVATGGGRNGGVMSFWAARKVLESITGK
jgi:glycine/D-amino acid oxidase-like deaminating enzyme